MDVALDGSRAQLCQALLDSRERWQGFGSIAADILFEAGADGRLSFLWPGTVLGWDAAGLLGRPASSLLPGGPGIEAAPFTGRRAWAQRADGAQACLSISAVPMLDPDGACIGVRGAALDVTAQERRESQAAAALRRAEVLDHILDRMRQEVLAPRMMQAVLDGLQRALGGRGAAVLELAHLPDLPAVLHQAGQGLAGALPDLLALLQDGPDDGIHAAAGLRLLTCQASTRFGQRTVLVVWREASARPWDAEDGMLIASVAGVVRIVLEHEAIQRELARQARTDPLTGLLNRRAFLDEAGRRMMRLDRDGLPGTLIFIDLDRLKPLNDRLGHEAGDAALVLTSALLRRTFRPADLVARLGGDEFALWLDGSDELTAAERAEGLRLGFPHEMARFAEGQDFAMTMSIGIACRQPNSDEDLDQLIQRADSAMYAVKRAGRGHWRVSHPDRAA